MDNKRLVYMANQIAHFFDSYAEPEAVAAVENHLRRFWDPRMRKALSQHVAVGGEGLEPITLAAAKRLTADAKAA